MKNVILIIVIPLIFFSCSEKGELIHVPENSSKGFEFPYLLFLPDKMAEDQELTIIVEPNNSGFVSDDLQKHIEKAERIASKDFYVGNFISRELKYPLLVPTFPRPEKNWKIYSHSLDRDVMLQKDNKLERIDLQLLSMIEDAKTKLNESGYSIRDKIMLTGFSASGTFANRFTLIHPEKVFATAAGGLNGLLSLPLKELGNRSLDYPIGVNDFQDLFNLEFNKNAFAETPQYYFMGELDTNDAIPYDDGYNDHEREVIYDVLGKEMLSDRWNTCVEIYKKENINVRTIVYEGTGHEQPEKVKTDILDFFRQQL